MLRVMRERARVHSIYSSRTTQPALKASGDGRRRSARKTNSHLSIYIEPARARSATKQKRLAGVCQHGGRNGSIIVISSDVVVCHKTREEH